MGGVERAVRAGPGLCGAFLPHGAGNPRRSAEREDLLHGGELSERLHVRSRKTEEGERARPRLALHLSSLQSQSRRGLPADRRAAAQAREELQRRVRRDAGRSGMPGAAGVRPRDAGHRMDGILAGEVGCAPRRERRSARDSFRVLLAGGQQLRNDAPELRARAVQRPQADGLSASVLPCAPQRVLLPHGRGASRVGG